MTEEQTKKVEISEKIKQASEDFNKLIDEAGKLNLYVTIVQKWHPLMNTNGAPINPPIRIEITEKINY